MVYCRWAIIPDDLFSSNEVLSYLCTLIVICCVFPAVFYIEKGLHTTWENNEKVEKTREKELCFVFFFPISNTSSLPWRIPIPLMDMQITNEKEK